MNPFRNRNGHSINGDLISRLTKKYGSLLRARVCALRSGGRKNEFLLFFLSSAQRILYLTHRPTDDARRKKKNEFPPPCFSISLSNNSQTLRAFVVNYVRPINHSAKFHYPTRNSGETKKRHGVEGEEGRQEIFPPLEIFLRSTNNDDINNNNNNPS